MGRAYAPSSRPGIPWSGWTWIPARPRVLAVGDDGVARLYRLDTGELLWSHRPVSGGAAALLEGGRSVVLISGSRLVTLDAATGRPRGDPVPVRLAGVVDELVPSPDGRSAIVLTGEPRARVIALSTGAWLGRVKHPRVVTDAAFSPDGRRVVSVRRDRVARVWSTTTWREVIDSMKGHNGQVLAVAFDGRDSASPTGSTDPTARVWRARDGRLFTTLFGHTANVSDAAFGPGGVLVTASSDGTARTWRGDGMPARARARRPPWARPEGGVRGRRIGGHRQHRAEHPRVGSRHQHRSRRLPESSRAERGPPESGLAGRQRGRAGGLGTSSTSGLLSASECSKATRTPWRARRGRFRAPTARSSSRRRAGPRRDRLGRRDRRGGVPDRGGPVGLRRGRAVQPRRSLAHHGRPEVCTPVDGRRPAAGALCLRPRRARSRLSASSPTRARSSHASATASCGAGNASSAQL